MELSECIIIFGANHRHFGASVQGIITATFNSEGGNEGAGIYVQQPNKTPERIYFDQILSLTVLN